MRSTTRRTSHGLLLAALAGLAVAAPSIARADRVHGTRSEKLVETAHWVSMRMDRGHADLVVRRTVHNGGRRHDQAMFWLDLPDEAVATGLRTAGESDGRIVWFNAELMEAEAAAARYRELTGIGGYYPKDPALLSWRHQGLLALQVFPVPPSQPKTVEYTLAMPAHYHGGRYHVSVPPMGTERLHAKATVSAANAEDRVFVGDKAASAGTGFQLVKDTLDVALAPRGAATLEGALASVVFDKGRVLSHFQVAAAPKLSVVPRGAHVVVLLDTSRSLREGQVAAGAAAARAMLSHLPDASVEVLTFDRTVRARHGGFVPVSTAIADLGKIPAQRRNGSHIDEALARADALLSALPARIPRRIVAVTDLLTRAELTPERVRPLLAHSKAVLHVGVVGSHGSELRRNDDHPWSAVTHETGGLVWDAATSAEKGDAAEMARVYEEWARPMRLHHFKVDVTGFTGFSAPETLDEGEGVEDLRLNDAAVTEVAIAGELWGTPVRKVLTPDVDEGRRWSALAFGSPLMHSLSEKEMMVLALNGHAVSPVTSLLAIEPGVRPSTEGLEEGIGEGGGGRGEGIGLGSIGTIGHGSGSGFDPLRFLRDALAPGLVKCGGAGRHATVTLESTFVEVVDVPSVTVQGANAAAIERCLSEAAWELELPGGFAASWASWRVHL
jgi:hypothetical protein